MATVRQPKERGSLQVDLRDKLRGGYYTRIDVAQWLADWAIRSKDDRVLEPSAGDGVFLEAAVKTLTSLGTESPAKNVFGVEIVKEEVIKARKRLRDLTGQAATRTVVCEDFFQWQARKRVRFTCAVGNPPFIRYQSFPEPARTRAMELMKSCGLRPNKLTNIWVPFLVGAAEMLEEGGRMAFIVPAELLQVSYAGQLRRFLADRFRSIDLVACNHLFFKKAQQEVLLLLADDACTSDRHKCSIRLSQEDNVESLLSGSPKKLARQEHKQLNHDTEKWLKYFLTNKEISLMRKLREATEFTTVSEHAEVDVGVVTGKNQFFIVSNEEIEQYDLSKFVMPLVPRSSHLRGAIITRKEWRAEAKDGARIYLLAVSEKTRLTQGLKSYIRMGESEGYHEGYKCSIRDPWHAVPSIWKPDAFLFRQIYNFPRIVLNKADATSTDTIHRVRCLGDPKVIAAGFYTYLTAASAEIEGRSYGGGVLELEPTEAERLLMPKAIDNGLPIDEIDRLVRAGKLEEAITENDSLLLRSAGLSVSDCKMLKQIWVKMRDRRSRRKR